MTNPKLNQRIAAIRDEYAEEEAEAAAVEVAVSRAAEQTTMSVRVPATLAAQLKQHAEAQHTSTSALVRQLLMTMMDAMTRAPAQRVDTVTAEQIGALAIREHSPQGGQVDARALTPDQVAEVERIARRVAEEVAAG
ncbi:ribbon-helix-helix protein, CopG family [Actinokineospora iranica]|uniref:Ribbon-helix-helix protein, copG family n=1 Tax=Actinokineospora iranica TaxID=1271860 RepID=A0A1G6N962_9PSEU|nr:ribbon-helix-helix protein, CopG family [Actinokineospora iranica]SDC64412.1 Ribbon-helix-helix protein, copG family [Actinokineospora iranica]